MTEQRESLLQDGRLGEIRLNAFAGQHMRGTKRQLEEDIRYLLHLLKAQDEELRRCMTDEFVDDVEQAAREQAEPRKEDTDVTASDYEAVEAELSGDRLDTRILYFTAGGYGRYGTHAYQHGDHYFCYQ